MLPWRYGPSNSSEAIRSSQTGTLARESLALGLQLGQLLGRSFGLESDPFAMTLSHRSLL